MRNLSFEFIEKLMDAMTFAEKKRTQMILSLGAHGHVCNMKIDLFRQCNTVELTWVLVVNLIVVA